MPDTDCCASRNCLVEASGNAFFIDTIKRVNRVRRRLSYRSMQDRSRYPEHCRQHLYLLALLEQERNEEASAFMREHLQRTLKAITQIENTCSHDNGRQLIYLPSKLAMTTLSSAVRSAPIPSGTLRASINLGNPILANAGAAGRPCGVSVDLTTALAQLLQVELELVVFDAAGKPSRRWWRSRPTSVSLRSTRCAAPRSRSPRRTC